MRRIWVSTAALAASVSVASWMAQSSAEEKRPGAALPPPSLFDDAPNQVRAVDAPAGIPASAVVQAKPAATAGVKAEASLPPPEDFEAEQTGKVVWWKPWTWFSGRTRSAETQREAAAPVTTPAPAAPVAGETAPAPGDGGHRVGYAFDSPSKRIRSGTGSCLKTGMWDASTSMDACGNPIAGQNAAAAPAAPAGTAKAATAAEALPGAASMPVTARASSPVPVSPPLQPDPAVVSPLAPEQDDQRKPLAEKDAFDSVRVNAGASGASDQLSPAAVAAARAKDSAAGADRAMASEGADVDDRSLSSGKQARSIEDKPLSMSAEALFGFKSATLLYGGKKQLDEFARKLSDGDYQSVRVVGHTDRVGTPQRNRKLSMRRAQAVKDYLVRQGVSPNRIQVDGRGAEDAVTEPRQCDGLPVVARRACMSPDRRVEIVVTRAFAKKKPEAAPSAAAPRS